MPKYTVIYEVVEKYDATLEGDYTHDFIAHMIENGHYSEDFDRSWREGGIRIVDVWEENND